MFFAPYQATTVLDIKLKYYRWGYSRWCKTILKPRANGRNIVGCYMLRPFAHPVVCCCAKFETGQTFQPTTPNISFVP